MSAHIGAVSSVNALIGKVFTQPKGDLAGRLNSRFTVAILAVSSGLLLSTHFWGDPITCWTPAEFPRIWSDFVNQFCYVEGTYFAKLDEQLEFKDETRQRNFINYYQWIPYFLTLQAFAFYMPRFIWDVLASFSGFDLGGCVKYTDVVWHKVRGGNFQGRMDVLEKQVGTYIWDAIRLARRHKRGRMVFYYIIYTVVQATNAWLMFYWLNDLIDSPLYSFHGASVIASLLSGESWQESGHFPRITHCDVPRRMLANSPKQTVNCVLTLNIYYEKLLLFLWFWMLFVCLISSANCISWLMTMCTPARSQERIRAYLACHAGSVYLDKFFRALGHDGVFVLHQLALNIGDLPASYVAMALYNVVIDFDHETHALLEKTGAKEV
ncbi:unnamed protein product [Bursaphelenchus okinawaensis]|uniref:Innexin n=1 Tax=Bursaphelenchus okinawaensis TaxID=465554 RepID=A0A811KS79_9BILA|nr:unnamed protein product [Bursaphelenchus okinawaensis]CAG9110004.1 unnamed protein product [Bursaphelenchus okinawaensis]